jgi:hypothetical protein
MRSILITAAAVLSVIAIGVGSLAAFGQARLARPSRTASPAASATYHVIPTDSHGLCSEIPAISGAKLHRIVTLPQNHPQFSFPPIEAIDSATTAQGVARALCALPRVPKGAVFSCPMDAGVHYDVIFRVNGSRTTVTVNPWGCEFTGGAMTPREADGPAGRSMWRTLGRAIGLRHATSVTFAGSIS